MCDWKHNFSCTGDSYHHHRVLSYLNSWHCPNPSPLVIFERFILYLCNPSCHPLPGSLFLCPYLYLLVLFSLPLSPCFPLCLFSTCPSFSLSFSLSLSLSSWSYQFLACATICLYIGLRYDSASFYRLNCADWSNSIHLCRCSTPPFIRHCSRKVWIFNKKSRETLVYKTNGDILIPIDYGWSRISVDLSLHCFNNSTLPDSCEGFIYNIEMPSITKVHFVYFVDLYETAG